MAGVEGSEMRGVADASPLKGFGALLASSLAARALGLLKLLLFAPLLGPAAFGAFRLASSAANIMFSLAALGIHTSYLRYLPELPRNAQRRRYMLRSLALSMGCTLFVALLLQPVLPRVTMFIFSESTDPVLALLLLVALPTILLYQSGTGITRGLGLFAASAFGEVLQNFLHVGLGLAAIMVLGVSASAVFGAMLVGFLVAGVLMLAMGLRATPKDAGDATLPVGFGGRVLRFSVWYALIPVCQYLFDFTDRWALARFRGLESAGVYSLVPLFTGGMIVLGTSLAPVVARTSTLALSSKTGPVYTTVWSSISIAVLGSLVYSVAIRLGEPLIWMVASGQWAAASSTVPWFLVYFSWFNAYYVIGAIATVEEATWVHLASLGVGGAMNLALNLILVPSHGMEGAAFATCVSILGTIATHVAFVQFRGIPIPGRFWVALALPLCALMPVWALVPVCILAAVLAAGTSLIVDAQGKAELLAYCRGIVRRFRRP
ncbi:oligosaccharide flippase family protein [bacterium]|nr:oligosaccharide flippase family protein [bacterium]